MFPRTTLQRVLALALLAAALGILAAASMETPGAKAPETGLLHVGERIQPEVAGASSSRISDSTLVWVNAAMPQGMFAQMDPEVVAKVPLPSHGHPAADRAMLLMACKDFADSGDAVSAELAQLSGLKPDDPNVEMMMFLREVQGIRCRNVGHVDTGQVDILMAEAAAAGNPRARTYVGAKLLAADLRMQKGAEGDVSLAPVSAQARSAAREMLELARTGDTEAIGQAYLVASTDRYGLADPIAAAAWKLVLAQDRMSSAFDPAQPKGQPPADMPAADRNLVIARAREYFDACCTRPGTSR